jgi:hypothetical protein
VLPAAPSTPPDAPYAASPGEPLAGVLASFDGPPGSQPPVAPGEPPAADAGNALPTALDIPRDTTPTFELEMLVSGAITFGLFQLPPLLDAAAAHIEPHYGLGGIFAAAVLAVLLKAALYMLIGCFVLHLALRGYWVACVGVQSVFPRGVRWERMRESGPLAREVMRERAQALGPIIARLDNAASLVFAAGFVLAMSAVSSVAGLGAAFLLVTGTRALGLSLQPAYMGILSAAVVLPFVLAGGVDYKLGGRLTGAPRRWVRRLIRAQLALVPRSAMTLQSVVSTNVDKRAVYGFTFTGFLAALGLATLPKILATDVPGASHYRFFADEQPTRALHASYYDDLRGTSAASTRAPSIPSMYATEPFVRLFVPYVILRHDEAIPRECPGVRPLTELEAAAESPEASAAADAVLRCAMRIHRPALDGQPLDRHGFRFFSDPRTSRRGFVLLIPTAGLASGEHRLTVWPAYSTARRTAGRQAPDVIPFWR